MEAYGHTGLPAVDKIAVYREFSSELCQGRHPPNLAKLPQLQTFGQQWYPPLVIQLVQHYWQAGKSGKLTRLPKPLQPSVEIMSGKVILSVYILTFLFGLPANLLALYAFVKKIRVKPTPTDILLLNLTISDLLFLIFLPLKMYEAASEMRWLLPSFLCSITIFFFFSTIYTSSLLLMGVSVDRYLCVAFPILYKIHRRPLYGVICSGVIWLTTSTHLCFVYVVNNNPTAENQTLHCYNSFTHSQLDVVLPMRLELCLVLYILPLFVCVFCYTRFILILRRTPNLNREKRRRAMGMALGTLLVFVVCFMPYNISHIQGFIIKKDVSWRAEALLLTTVNTVFDPITFYFSSATFQGNLKGLLRNRTRTSHPSPELTPVSTIQTIVRLDDQPGNMQHHIDIPLSGWHCSLEALGDNTEKPGGAETLSAAHHWLDGDLCPAQISHGQWSQIHSISFLFLQPPAVSTMVNHLILLSAYILTFLIGMPANILALYAFIRKLNDNPTPTDILLLNLTASDILFLLFLPLKMYEAASDLQWYLPQALCSITSFIFFTTIYTSSLLLMAISVDRYLAVSFPIAYRKFRKLLYAVATSAFIWLFAGAHCSFVFIVVHMKEGNSTIPKTRCYENFTDSQKRIVLPMRLEFFVVLCLVPLLVSIFCYLNCIWILYTRPRITKEKKQRAIGMAAGTLTVFLVCFLPYNISHVVGFSSNQSPEWRYYTLLLSTFNTSLDPIIFYFSSTSYRNTTKLSFWRLWSLKGHKGTSPTTSADPDVDSQNVV
ncbi:hypothetical protein NFI96_004342 [Prochilodus magdalenae]|nr:hypothetical protein NFI96_004342 [Prochilodus magdalenae]